MLVLFEALEKSEVWDKIAGFYLQNKIFFVGKNSCHTKLYLLDLFRFGHKFGIFHYAKLPSYKRVK